MPRETDNLISLSRPGQVVLHESSHTYSMDGKSLESVTKVIGSVLNIDVTRWWKPEHRNRGKYVHAITEAIDEGCWNEGTTIIPEEQDRQGIIQRCYAYQDFLNLTGFKSILVEAAVASVPFGVAGTLDRYGLITKGAYKGRYAILDIKSGLPTAAAILQLALYEICYKETFATAEHAGRPDLRIILHLRADGKCRPEFREGPADLADAVALVRVFRFKERNAL